MTGDEPVPVRRAAVGCLLVGLLVAAIMLLVRPAIFSLAPPRDDSAVVVATASDVAAGPVRRDVLLTRSYGWAGEIDAGDGRRQLSVVVSPSAFGGIVVVSAGNPLSEGCELQVQADRLVDCEGRAWTFEGAPLDSSHPALERFPVEVEDGSVIVDLTRTLDA